MRLLTSELSDWLGEVLGRGRIPVALYEAPTGYGKTSSGAIFFRLAREAGLASSYIHVLPLRAIVDDLFRKLVKCEVPGLDCGWLRSLKVGYQMMEYAGLGLDDKSPYFLRQLVVTTFDSFVYNLARLPVAELDRQARHYEIPRSSILTSMVVLDEAHLYGGDVGLKDTKMFDALASSVRALSAMGVPIIVESATLPNRVARGVMGLVREARGVEVVRYQMSRCDAAAGDERCLWDEEYADAHRNIDWRTRVVNTRPEDLSGKAIEYYERGCRVLAMFNTPRRAIRFYRSLLGRRAVDEGDVVLLHGRLTAGDRRRSLDRLNQRRGAELILVSTQVVEAGVDISFDVLFTDAAPPTVITQRAGRVARYGGDGVVEVYVNRESMGEDVYDRRVVEKTVEVLEKTEVDWRLPEDRGGRVSYKSLIERVYSGVGFSPGSGDIALDRVMTEPVVTNKHLNDLLGMYCGSLVRDPLIVCYVAGGSGGCRPASPQDLDPGRLLVVNKKVFQRLMNKGLVCMEGDKVLVASADEPGRVRGEWRSMFVDCKKLVRVSRGVVPLIKEGAYREGVGLVIDLD